MAFPVAAAAPPSRTKSLKVASAAEVFAITMVLTIASVLAGTV